ncbi:S26 family signal peptidase [Desulforhopalus singaporensis]|uniref:Conjugative transfer signal peptidase TraF n=1 Tax=Desulforhopalus singaporensis TaxID=91360 RepID=A0A1H0S210_9BACT|nr:S26 family signal peptidase [Desulforhopalus singaporensis]SDP35792.1 conjugative transfer signal peptidase TraF [Desulforhopalus singaporensis]
MRLLKLIVCILVVLGLYLFIAKYCYINTTASLPYGIYLKTNQPIEQGVLVAFYPPASKAEFVSRYTEPGTPLLKKVTFIGGEKYHLPPAAEQDSRGRPVIPYIPATGIVPQSHVIVEGETIHSLDSRYIGPIPTKLVITTIKPLWTW